MTKYLAQSASVLNKADRTERILNYRQFCFDQEMLLWGYAEGIDWRPGVPLYQDPRRVGRSIEDSALEGYYGHRVRPMFQTYEYVTVDVFDWRYDRTNRAELYLIEPEMDCLDCGVSWSSQDDACWVCGKEINGWNNVDEDLRGLYCNEYLMPNSSMTYREMSNFDVSFTMDFNLQPYQADYIRALYEAGDETSRPQRPETDLSELQDRVY